MNRETILDEIRRAADVTPGGKLGLASFERISGISQGIWRGKYWTNWTEAVQDAGVVPGEMSIAYSDVHLLKALADLVRTYKRFPTYAQIKIQKARDAKFPNHATFDRLGSQKAKIEMLRQFAIDNANYSDILQLLPSQAPVADLKESAQDESSLKRDGHVYMMKLGKHYKIGHTSSVPRRHREINLELPEKTDVVHTIATDDPEGIEAYWHHRFASKNSNGEWFSLSAEDIRAFKRRKFM